MKLGRHRWRVLAGALAAMFAIAAACSTDMSRNDVTKQVATGTSRTEAGPSVVPGYLGSRSCAPCHEREFALWQASLHSKMEQPATRNTVLGNFTEQGTTLAAEADGRSMTMIRRGQQFEIVAPDAEGKPHTYAIERTIGNRYRQRYLTKLADGSWHALPVQWLIADQKFVEPLHLASRKPGSGDYWLDDAWQWQVKCAGCHTTGLDLGFDADTKHYDTRWQELAIGCESCHGTGASHVAAKGGTSNILCPSKMTHAQQLDVCGKCHSRGSSTVEQGAPAGLVAKLAFPYNMVPGTALDRVFTAVTPQTSPADFWPDGSAKNHHQQLIDFRHSHMLEKGGDKAPHCTTCHDPHDANALKLPVQNNALCVSCHEPLGDASQLAQHTGHGSDPEANAGARCVECHMPRSVQHAGSVKIHSHRFASPDPRRASELKMPDTCLLCHHDRDSAWSQEAAAKLWPQAPR